jgi:tetratricopeptide (TPR) repeat protein
MTTKSFKLCLYKKLARFPLLLDLPLFLTFTVALVLIIWVKGVPLRPGTDLWVNIAFIILAVIWLFLFFSGIFIWAWYFVLFRYLAYGASRVISLFWGLLKNTFFQFIIILAASAWFWAWRKGLFPGKEYKPREMLMFFQAIKIFVIAVLVYAVWKIIKVRNRTFISKFENYTGDEKLEPAVKGVAARILNEASRLSKLLKTIDRIQPESEKDISPPPVNVHEMVKGIDEIMGWESNVDIGKVKIPLKPIYAFFYRLLHGPILSGGVHLKGEKLVVTACLKGGKYSGSWEIGSDDIENPPTAMFEQLIAITDQLVCRIIAQISQGGSPRWKAMSHYTRALNLYRESLLKREKKKLNLIKAKNEFSMALTDDSKFGQCYYRLGIIYDELKSNHAAIASFRKALESAPDNYNCYYQLALLYYKEKNYFDARWFCEQALTICPNQARHWNLWAVIQFKKSIKDNDVKDDYEMLVNIPAEVVQYFMIASALSCRALCKSIINGEKILQFKETASVCIRNLAVTTGMKKMWRSRYFFNQAIFLDPDNNELHFEAGRYYYRYYSDYRKKKIIKAYEAFKRVFEDDKEVDNPFSYWAFYINVNAQLYAKKREQKYKEIVEEGFFYFLDAASEIIQNENKMPLEKLLTKDFKIHESQVSDALNFKKPEYGFLVELIDILNVDYTNISDWENKINQKIINYFYKWKVVFRQSIPKLSDGFVRWAAAQLVIKSAILILNSRSADDFPKVRDRLSWAIEILKEKNPNVLKRLGLKRYLAEAYYLSKKKDYNKALKFAREAVRLDPYDWEIRELFGDIYFALNDYQQAVIEYEISALLEEHCPAVLIKFLKKIGKAYEESGKILRDPGQRKDAFNKAVEFFTDYLEMLEDKSYENNDEENGSQYIDLLAEIHFYLGSLNHELLNYDDAITHFKIARKMGYDELKALLNLGWTYFDCGNFNEAEQAFNEAKPNPDWTSAEIKLGIAFSQVERTLHFDKKNLPEDKEPLKILKDAEKRIKKVTNTDEKSRLSALYHECRGRLHFKQEQEKDAIEEAGKEFEKSLAYRANPRVYYYLAELYWKKAMESEDPFKNPYLAKTRSAYSLCFKNDLQQKYKNEVSECLERLKDFEKQPKET